MKTYIRILQDLVDSTIALTDKITNYDVSGVIRGIYHALANVISEIWNDLYQVKRQIFPQTAEGTSLDAIGARSGLTRRGASKSTAIVLFSGPADTVIPQYTIVKSNLSNISYRTLEEITLGTRNSEILRPLFSETIGDVVLAESLDTGSKTAVGVLELTQLQTPITGVTVTNLTPSAGGLDAESDDTFRTRIMNQISLLNQGTQLFYETLAVEADATVMMASAIYSEQAGGTEIYLVKNNLASFSSAELTAIQNSVYAGQRALNKVVCRNAGIRSIEVVFKYNRDSTIAQATIYSQIAAGIADYINSIFTLGAVVSYEEIANIIINTPGVELEVTSLLLNNNQINVKCGITEIPRFTFMSISDGTLLGMSITQVYNTPGA
jgi:uncharacterized phage protein gp47/JayE